MSVDTVSLSQLKSLTRKTPGIPTPNQQNPLPMTRMIKMTKKKKMLTITRKTMATRTILKTRMALTAPITARQAALALTLNLMTAIRRKSVGMTTMGEKIRPKTTTTTMITTVEATLMAMIMAMV